jgi:hypothetical protein
MIFEDLIDMRDDIEYGTRVNRRLHTLPITQSQDSVSYETAWSGIPN